MSIVPGRSDSPPCVQAHQTNKFARVDNNPNVRNAQYYAPYVHGNQSNRNPQFYKSPLTSVQMYRKNRSKHMPINQGPNQIITQPQSKHGVCRDCDWKQILCWALLALALLGLALGLFFLIRSLMNKNDNQSNLRPYTPPDIAPAPAYTGINPIYVSPVPYSNMQIPTVSGFEMSPNFQDGYNYVTAPNEPQNTDNTLIQTKKEDSTPNSPIKPTTQPTIHWIPDPQNSYVNPLDVYKLYHD